MKFRSTWIFAGVVALLGAYSFYEFNTSDEDLRSDEVPLFDFKIDQVEQISLIGTESKIVVKRNGKIWQMMEPVKDTGDDVAMESLLLTVLGEKGHNFSENTGKDWTEYGLVPPRLIVELDSVDKTERLEVSSINAFDGSFYLRFKDRLLLGDKMWARVIDQKANSLRDRRILPQNEEATSVDVQVDTPEYKGKYSFKKAEEGWRMAPDPGFPVETLKVDHWLDDIQKLRANDFALEKMNSPEQFQLNKPSLLLTIHLRDKKVWSLRFSPDHGDEVHLKTSLKDFVYSIGQGLMRTIRVPPRFFRDGKLPFRFDLEKAYQVEAIQLGKALKFQKGDVDWKLLSEGELNQSRLVEFMQKLKSLEAVDFPPHGRGFETPSQKVKVTDNKEAVLLEFQVGGEYKPTEGMNKGVPLNFVRVSGQKQILGVKSQELKGLLAPDLVKGKSENH